MKFLIIRFSSIGDIVLTSPVVRCLALQTSAEVHFLTKKNFAAVVIDNPYLKKVWFWEDNNGELVKQLRIEKFDAVIDLHNNLRSVKLSWQLGVRRYTFPKLNFQKWVLVNFRIHVLPNVHIVDRYLKAVKTFGVINDGTGLDFFISSDNTVNVSQLSPLNSHLTPLNYIALVIGAAHATKRLPLHKLVALVQNIPQPIVILGGKDDVESASAICKTVQRNDVINACGRLNLQQSASVVQQASCVITHDTGLMHIAAAFNKTIISIWGNTTPAFGMYPYLKTPEKQRTANHQIFEVAHLYCRPCSKIGFNACPKKHFACMEQQNMETIAKAVSEIFI